MSEEVKRKNHHSVAITREAYDLITKKAELLHTDRKAIASEAIFSHFRERALILRMKGGLSMAFTAGVLFGMVMF